MSINDSILTTLNLKEENIHFDENFANYETIRGVQSIVYSGTLSYNPPDYCPNCGCLNENASIIKHGKKDSLITLPKSSRMNTYLRLSKQRFLCKSCNTTFSASSSIVNKNCFISNNSKLSIVLDAKKKFSQADIADLENVSHGTVNSILMDLYDNFIFKRNYLPKHLCFDEFKSVKSSRNKMSFIFLDAVNGNVINILEDRVTSQLFKYFFSYSRKARLSVETVCMDMYSPYMKLVKVVFPNAKIIIDRFHIVQLLSRALNNTRIKLMNQDKKNYNKLKRYWRIILKDEKDVDDNVYKKYICFSKLMRERDVLNYLLSLDPSFKSTYYLYQDLLHALKNKNPNSFISLLNSAPEDISSYMKTAVSSLLKYSDYVSNAMLYPFSNGVIEGTNNLIKTIKRIAFGYRSFVSFKVRILLISNTLVPLNMKRHNTFYHVVS